MHFASKISRSLFNSFIFADSVIMSLIETNSVYNITYVIIKFAIAMISVIDFRLFNLKSETDYRRLYQSLMNTKHLHYCLN